jgi:hypothetical protein
MATEQVEQSTGPQSNGAQTTTHRARETAQEAMDKVVGESATAMRRLGETLKEPTTGAAIAGAAVVGAAVFFGLVPTAIGATAGYVAYRISKRGHSEENK